MTRTSTATRCHYAPDPKSRPGCQLTATVRVGSIPLCSACAELRSTLGKGQPTRRLPTPTDTDAPDALDWVSQAEADLRAAHHTVAASVKPPPTPVPPGPRSLTASGPPDKQLNDASEGAP